MSVILHEVAHGYVAFRCGDRTAQLEGRLSLNPIVHIDPWYTILLPLMLFIGSGGQFAFGGAKPVPVSPGYLKKWPRDYILVSIAGVTVNIALGLGLALLARASFLSSHTRQALAFSAFLNFFLALFNLVPIPPLDGSRVFRFLLPADMRKSYDGLAPYGFVIIIVLWVTRILDLIIMPVLLQICHWVGILGPLAAWMNR